MGLIKRAPENRRVVTFFTAQETMEALYEKYPERFDSAPDNAHLWFKFVTDGLKVEWY